MYVYVIPHDSPGLSMYLCVCACIYVCVHLDVWHFLSFFGALVGLIVLQITSYK